MKKILERNNLGFGKNHVDVAPDKGKVPLPSLERLLAFNLTFFMDSIKYLEHGCEAP